jgi:hypothetical protein
LRINSSYQPAALATLAAGMAPDLVQLMPVLFAAVSRPNGMAVHAARRKR